MSAGKVDIVIAGAGLAGAPLAYVLASQGWSVSLLDSAPISTNQVIGHVDALEQRCTALSLGTRRWLDQQGLWDLVGPDACPIRHVHVSHKGYFGATRLSADELATEAVGYVVNNQTMLDSVLSGVNTTSVHRINNARVTSVEQAKDAVRIWYGKDAFVQAKLLIAADGVSSVVRESSGIATRQVDYDQCAVLGTVQLEGSHDGVAYERFTPTGPLALLPRPGPYMSFVECIDPSEKLAIEQLGNTAYLGRLQSRFGYRAGRLLAVGPRQVIPLVRIEALRQTAVRTVLLGNAARLLHPVGGQGYNLAMRDAAVLARLLSEQHEALSSCTRRDPGEVNVLAQFVAQRSADQKRVVQFTDFLARGFRGRAALPAHIRSLGLLGLDTLSPVRSRFARATMGLDPTASVG